MDKKYHIIDKEYYIKKATMYCKIIENNYEYVKNSINNNNINEIGKKIDREIWFCYFSKKIILNKYNYDVEKNKYKYYAEKNQDTEKNKINGYIISLIKQKKIVEIIDKYPRHIISSDIFFDAGYNDYIILENGIVFYIIHLLSFIYDKYTLEYSVSYIEEKEDEKIIFNNQKILNENIHKIIIDIINELKNINNLNISCNDTIPYYMLECKNISKNGDCICIIAENGFPYVYIYHDDKYIELNDDCELTIPTKYYIKYGYGYIVNQIQNIKSHYLEYYKIVLPNNICLHAGIIDNFYFNDKDEYVQLLKKDINKNIFININNKMYISHCGKNILLSMININDDDCYIIPNDIHLSQIDAFSISQNIYNFGIKVSDNEMYIVLKSYDEKYDKLYMAGHFYNLDTNINIQII
jgi:hypothetical protein